MDTIMPLFSILSNILGFLIEIIALIIIDWNRLFNR